MATKFQWAKLLTRPSKELIALITLIASIFGYGGYVARDVLQESKVMVSEETVPMVAKPSYNENTVARICGKVILKHQDSLWH